MKIRIKDIPDAGLAFQKTIHASEIDLSDDDFKVVTPISIDAMINRAEDVVIAKVEVSGKYAFTCSRCLEGIEEERRDRFDLYFDIEPKQESVDIGEDIRQEMLLIFTSAVVLCRTDCKGICVQCGVNLNREECHHGAPQTTAFKAEKP